MMCLPGRVFVRLDRSPPSSRGKMDESAPETDRHWSMKGWSRQSISPLRQGRTLLAETQAEAILLVRTKEL
jgi:hypothetical protein